MSGDDIRDRWCVLGVFDSWLPGRDLSRGFAIGRFFGKTEEIAAVIALPASQGGGYIAGENLRVDGDITRSV